MLFSKATVLLKHPVVEKNEGICLDWFGSIHERKRFDLFRADWEKFRLFIFPLFCSFSIKESAFIKF